VWVTGLVVPKAEVSPKFQLYEYGVVPPVTVAVKVTGLPTVGLVLTVKVTVGAVPATAIAWGVAVAVFGVGVLESVTVRVTVWEPLAV